MDRAGEGYKTISSIPSLRVWRKTTQNGKGEWEESGRPPTPPRELPKALLVQQYQGVTNGKAELLLFREKFDLSREPSYEDIKEGM